MVSSCRGRVSRPVVHVFKKHFVKTKGKTCFETASLRLQKFHHVRAQCLQEFDAVIHIRGSYENGEDEVSLFTVEDARVVRDVGKAAGFVRGFLRGIGVH